MPATDTGNWDLVIEVATSALQRVVGGLLPSALPASAVSSPAFNGTVTPHLAPGSVNLDGDGDITIGISIDGTVLHVDELNLSIPSVSNPPPAWLATIGLRGQVRITDYLEMQGNDLVIDFSPGRLQPHVAVLLEEDSLLSAPLVQFALAAAYLAGGQTAYLEARTELVEEVERQIGQQVRSAIIAKGRVVVVAAPSFVGNPIASSALRTDPQSLHLCYALCNPAGSVGAISRSMLLTTTAGVRVDVAAFAINNACLLGCFLKPRVMRRLGLPASGFRSDHPCLFFGPSSIAVPGLPQVITEVKVNSLITGIDEAGQLRLQVDLTANGVAGAFKITASTDFAFAISASVTRSVLSIEFNEARPPIVDSDIAIEWWVYLAGGLTGGIGLATIIGLADVLGDKLLDGPMEGLIKDTVDTIPPVIVPLPGAMPPVRVREVNSKQPDSVRRSISPSPPIFKLPDPFRSHDLIINFI